jgi:large subunit ribosomal protein L21
MEIAVIKTGGKQYLVKEGDTIFIEKLAKTAEGGSPDATAFRAGDTISFDEVLLVDNGSDTMLGAPLIKGAAVKATVIKAGKAPKVEVLKYKAKSRYYKRRGHRQPELKVKIDAIS